MVLAFADEMKKLAENITASYNGRMGTVKDIIKDTQSTLNNFHSNRMHMAEELRSELAGFTKELTAVVHKMADETKRMMNALANEHKEMAVNLHNDLGKFHRALTRDTHTMLKDFKTNFEKMSQELHSMLSGYYRGEIQKPVHDMLVSYHNQMKALANDFHRAHEAWMNLARSMHAAKAGPTPEAVVSPKAAKRRRKYSRRK